MASPSTSTSVAEGLRSRAVAVRGSVDVLDDVRAIADASIAALGPIDILVNNAGIASRGHSVAKTDPDQENPYLRYSLFIVEADTDGWEVVREIPVAAGPHGLCVWPQPGRWSIGHTGITR